MRRRALITRALALLEANGHDIVVAYAQELDDAIHRTQTLSAEALAALGRHVGAFATLADAAHGAWKLPFAILFGTDHGTHVDPVTG